MTLSVWQRTIVNDSGDVLGSATVTVRRESDNALATLYDNPAGTGSPLSNPLTADSAGFAQFYVIAGVYRITAASGSFSAVWRHVQLGTAQSVESDQNLRTTDTATFAGLWVDNVTIDGSTIGTATGEDLTLSPQGDVIIPANVDVTGDVTVAGDITFTGALDVDNLRLDGSTISTTTTGDNMELAPLSGVLTVDGDVVPKTDGTSDLGSPSLEWQNLYIDGTANIDSLVADTADINGGTIDNTVIGGSVAAAGTFTSVDTEYVDFALGLSPSVTPAEGRVWFNSEDTGGTLYVGMAGGNVNQPIGEAQYFWVKASSAITKGQVVMASGVVGASGKIEGAPATGLTADTNLRVIGVAAENIALNDWGLVTSFGYVRNINTNAFNANDILYYDPSVAGGLTNAIPDAPSARVIVALCIVKGSGNGEILVRLTHERTLGDGNTNVQISGLGADHFLVYDNGDSRWENKAPADARTALGLGTIATQDANNVTISGGTINGTSVGASSASSGAFTTLSASGNVTLGDASTDTVTVNGYMGVGGAPNSSIAIFANPSALAGVSQTGIYSLPVSTSAATTVTRSFLSLPSTAAAAYTSADVVGYWAANALKGAGSTITNLHGVYIADQTQGTNNYGITSTVSSGSNKWNIYASGTAANYFAGNVGIGGLPTSALTVFTGDFELNGGTAARGLKATIEANTSADALVAFNSQIANNNAAMVFRTNSVDRVWVGSTETVINDPGNDYDFRVESDTNTHALFVEGSSGNVGIGTGTPSNLLTVEGSKANSVVSYLNNTDTANGNGLLVRGGGLNSGKYSALFQTADGSERFKVGNTEAVFNDPGNDYDFRVESDTNTHAFFVDGGNSRVGINNSTPDTMLHLSDTLGGAVLRLERNDTSIAASDQYGAIEFEGQDANAGASGVRASLRAISEASLGQTSLLFYTADASVPEAERLRVKSTGQLRFVPLAADPAGAEAGDVYYNSGTNKLKLYDGTSWVDLN